MKTEFLVGSVALAVASSAGLAQTVTLDNGIVGDGALIVKPDAYGAYTNWGVSGNGNTYNPNGPLGAAQTVFAAAWFLFDPDDAAVFAEPGWDLDNTYNFGRFGSFGLPTIINALVSFDTDGDGIDDTATSSWSSANSFGANDLLIEFALTQEVNKPDANGVSEMKQTLIVTNRSGGSRTFRIYRYHDAGLMWDNSSMDETGTARDCNQMIVPFVSDPDGSNATSVALSGTPGYVYCATRTGWDPDGAGPDPAMGGMGFEIWDNFCLYQSWKNETAGIGQPPLTGSIPGRQPPMFSEINSSANILAWNLMLDNLASVTLSFSSLHGTNGECLSNCPCACDFDPAPACDIFDFLAFQTAFVASEPCACELDPDPSCDIFDFLAFQTQFVAGCP